MCSSYVLLVTIQDGELVRTHTIAKLQEAVQHTLCKRTTAEKSLSHSHVTDMYVYVQVQKRVMKD